jgi:hypothetical protein
MKILRSMLALFAVGGLIVSPAAFAQGSAKSEAPVIQIYDGAVVGTSRVLRTKHGITAQIKTTRLTAGYAMTMWIIFFNNPAACAVENQCDPNPAGEDVSNQETGFDFHYAAGHVVNGNTTTLSGHLRAGETSTSGGAEVGAPAVALMNPFGAQVFLAVHSHGPAQTGQDLAAQMSSFLGGCYQGLLGPGGIAVSPEFVPDDEGECSTTQIAFH